MPLRTSHLSEQERADIAQEWDKERSCVLANLSTARRSTLRFVPANKTDEEWSAISRATLADKGKGRSEPEKDGQSASFYRELPRSGARTPVVPSSSHSVLSQHRQQNEASSSKVTIESAIARIKGSGSKEEPLQLSDDEDGHLTATHEEDANSSIASMQTDAVALRQPGQPVEPVPVANAGPEISIEPITAPPNANIGDMYCLLCKILVSASDVPGHPTSILHQLSRSPHHTVANPLVPPITYGIKPSNIGYSMLKRAGWTEDSALGNSDGEYGGNGGRNGARKTPLKASDKFDRKGLGVESKRRRMLEEREGKIDISSRRERENKELDAAARAKKTARPLAKNRREMEKDRLREMKAFKEGLAYLNS